MMSHMLVMVVVALWLGRVSVVRSQTTLASVYVTNFTFNESGSPYIANQDIIFYNDLVIEKNVEILFENGHTIEVRGDLDGCTDTSLIGMLSQHIKKTLIFLLCCSGLFSLSLYFYVRVGNLVSHIDDNIRGLSQSDESINITGNGWLYIRTDTSASASLCNILFKDVPIGIQVGCCGGDGISIDNSEFYNINGTVVSDYSGSNVEISNTIFDNFAQISSSADIILDNCKFTNFDTVLSSTERISIYNSNIYGSNNTCLYGGRGTLRNNTITNCDIAVKAFYEGFDMSYNTIESCITGIETGSYSSSTTMIQFNNFIDNDINVKVPGSINYNLTLNYWGTTDENEIGNKILDICDGYSTALATWWPYALAELSLNETGTFSGLQDTLNCSFSVDINGSVGNGTILGSTYLSSVTLDISGSPYYVYSDVIFMDTVNLEAGIEIIFTGDYTLDVRSLIQVENCTYDDVSVYDNEIGLSDSANNIWIHCASGHCGKISIDTDGGAGGTFCNVLFEDLSTAIDVTCCNSGEVFVDNCEFRDISAVLTGYSGYDMTIYDSLFTQFGYVASAADKIFYNCIFENFQNKTSKVLQNTERISIYDSFIYGTSGATCLDGGRGTLYNVTISGCGTAVEAFYEGFDIYFSNIADNDVAIVPGSYSGSTTKIQVNNFINNTVNVDNTNSVDQSGFKYNFWGSSDESTIADKILDICNGYGSGIVTWWPYFSSEIDSEAMAKLQANNSYLYNISTVINSSSIVSSPSDYSCGASSGNSSVLSAIYLSDTTLDASSSPYYVKSDVVVYETLTIDAGVEIIFTGDYTLEIRGSISACPDSTAASESSSRGLYDESSMIKLTGSNSSDAYKSNIYIDVADGASGEFCNVYFEQFKSAIEVSCCGSSEVTVDNCQFENNQQLFQGYSGSDVEVSDTIFNNFHVAASNADYVFTNCIFSNFSKVLYGTERISIYDSDIYGNNNWTDSYSDIDISTIDVSELSSYLIRNRACVYGGRGTLKNVTIQDCFIAYYGNWEGMEILFSNLVNNTMAVVTNSYYEASDVNYNNFLGNDLNIVTQSDEDFDATNNYFDTSLASVISARIVDNCDDGWSADGLVIFSPFYTEMIPANATNSSDLATLSSDAISTQEYEASCAIVDLSGAPTSSPVETLSTTDNVGGPDSDDAFGIQFGKNRFSIVLCSITFSLCLFFV